MQKSIAQLSIGQKAVITDFDSNVIPLKLIEMGCLPGNDIELIQIAPMGDPLDIVLRGYELTLRIEDAKNIEIEKTEENDHI